MIYEVPAPGRTIAYELIDFPFVPTLLSRATVHHGDLQPLARWLERELPLRVGPARSILRDLGAPAATVEDPRQGLRELGLWLQVWFPLVAEPYVERSYPGEPDWERRWLKVLSNDRLGNVVTWWPHQPGYSEIGDALLHSLIVDLTAVVMDLAQAHGAAPVWTVESVEHQLVLVARPSTPVFGPLVHIRELLLQSVGPIRGERSRSLRRRQSEFLVDCFDQAVTGNPPVATSVVFPEIRYRMMSRFQLKRPSRSAPAADARLLDCVRALRTVGFYQSWKHSEEDLARAIEAAWAGATGQSLPGEHLWTALVLMDFDRTWFEDVDVQVQGVSDQIYGQIVFALEKIGGPGFGSFADPEEDWRSSSDAVRFSVRWRRKRRTFTLPKGRDGIVGPSLFTQLDSLLPPDGPRLRYLDVGPTVAVVIRLTDDELGQLRDLTGLDILADPPTWWSLAAADGLTSLPSGRTDPLLMGTPVGEVFTLQPDQGPSGAGDELRGVSVTDMEVDGAIVFQVFVSAAEFIRGGGIEEALEGRVTAAIRSVAGVAETSRTDREVWEVSGDPREADLETAVRAAVESVLDDYDGEIADLLS